MTCGAAASTEFRLPSRQMGDSAQDATVAQLEAALRREHKKMALGMQMLGRWGAVSDLVGTVLFLCSSDAGFITAQTIFVDGGAQPNV